VLRDISTVDLDEDSVHFFISQTSKGLAALPDFLQEQSLEHRQDTLPFTGISFTTSVRMENYDWRIQRAAAALPPLC
jgi:hypothetical protein